MQNIIVYCNINCILTYLATCIKPPNIKLNFYWKSSVISVQFTQSLVTYKFQ